MSKSDDHSEDPYTPADALPPPAPREKPMGFWDHLEELRGTLIKSVVTMLIFAVLIGIFIKRFNQTLLWPLHTVNAEYPGLELKLVTQSMLEPFTMIIQLCFLGSFTLSAPFVLFYIAQFVAPALTEREMRVVLPMCISAMVLFLFGAAFGFFLLMPGTIRISIELTQMFELGFMWTVGKYYSTLMWLVLGWARRSSFLSSSSYWSGSGSSRPPFFESIVGTRSWSSSSWPRLSRRHPIR